MAQTAATARSSIEDRGNTEELNRDLVALGAGNLLAGLSGSFALNVSPPRSEVVKASGGRSQLSGLVAAAGVVVVLFAASLLTDLPQATLGAILIFVATKLFRATELRRVLRFDRIEFALAAITIAVVALIGIEQGVVVAVILALAQRTKIAARPRGSVLGREPGTDHWIPLDVGQVTEQVPGVVVYLLYAPVWYGNASNVTSRLRKCIDSAPQPVDCLVLDANGISDIDYTGARELGDLAEELSGRGLLVGVARASQLVRDELQRSGVLDLIGADHVFPTVQDAVESLAPPP